MNPPRRHRGLRQRLSSAVVLLPVTAFLLAPLIVLATRSDLAAYGRLTDRNPLLGTSPLQTVGNSLGVAVTATIMALAVGTLASFGVVHGRRGFGRTLDLGLLLPLGTSAVTLGFGLFVAFDEGALDLRTSWWILPIAHALIGVPFVMRAVIPVLRSIDPDLRAAAHILGSSPTRAWRDIDLPIARRSLMVGAAFAFAVSMGEFGATSVLPRSSDHLTAPVAVFRLLSTPGATVRADAYALAVVLAIVVMAAVAVIERFRSGSTGSGW